MARSKEEKKSKKRKLLDASAEKPSKATTSSSPSKKRKKHDGSSQLAAKEDEVEPTLSSFHTQTMSLYLPLSSISLNDPKTGICAEHLSPLLLTYFPPAQGTILSYSNVQLSEQPLAPAQVRSSSPVLARSIDEFPVSFIWVTVDFLIFRPSKGVELEGFVHLHNQSHLGLLCYNLFNVSIPASRLPKDWSWVWIDDGRTPPPEPTLRDTPPPSGQAKPTKRKGKPTAGDGYFVDADSKKVDGLIRFRVRDVETAVWSDRDNSFIGVEGTLLDEKEEAALNEKEAQKTNKKGNGRPQG